MTKRFGFTLAEVLITLGIIGVVAAMTIPTLISNTNGAQFKTAYKKALSTLNQAVLMNIAMDDTDFSDLTADAASGTNPTTARPLSSMLSERLQSATDITESYFKEVGTAAEDDANEITIDAMEYKKTVTCTGAGQPTEAGTSCTAQNVGQEVEIDANIAAPTNSTWRVYSFADGTAFAYDITAADCDAIKNNCVGFIDVNGSTGPNTPISCADAANGTCTSAEITDIFPVFFHGQTVEPANDSARAVLFGK